MNLSYYVDDIVKLCQNRVPGQLVIQFTDHCNAKCPQCGMRVTERFRRSRLSQSDIKRMLDAARENGFKVVSFTGGEPLLFLEDLVELVHYAGRSGIDYTRTGTNGFVFANPEKNGFQKRVTRVADMLSETPLRNLWISIDSVEPSVHEEMRGFPGLIGGIEKALPLFHERGLFPAANLGINRRIGGSLTESLVPPRDLSDEKAVEEYLCRFYDRFREAFQRFFTFIMDLGFTMVNMCYPMSFDSDTMNTDIAPVYAANSTDRIVHFSPMEKVQLFKALLDTIPEFRSKIRVFSPRSSLFALYRQYRARQDTDSHHQPYACRGGIDFFFVDSTDGNTYPCGFRGSENLGKFWDMNGHGRGMKATCDMCDWECFRDPSELFGPVLEGLHAPLHLMKRLKKDSPYFRLWLEDLKYYQACCLFDGRKAPDMARLAVFQSAPVTIA